MIPHTRTHRTNTNTALPRTPRVRRLAQLLALATAPNHVAHRLLDLAPVVLLGNRRRRLVDAAVLQDVDAAGNLKLLGRVRDDLLVLEHELVAVEELIVRRRAAEPAFLGAVSAVWVFVVLEVVFDLVETLFTHEFVALAGRQVPPVDDGVDELARVALEVAAALDAADALEAQRVPDLARRHVGLVDEVEDAVRVAQAGRPVDVGLAHEAAHAAVARGVGDEEARVAHVAAPPGVVGLDVEAAEALLGPVLALDDVVGAGDVAEEHDGAKVLEPISSKPVRGEGVHHGIRVAAVDLLVELVAEVDVQRGRDLVRRRKGHNRGHRLAVPERHLSGHNVGREPGAVRIRIRRGPRDSVNSGARRVIHHGRHLGRGRG